MQHPDSVGMTRLDHRFASSDQAVPGFIALYPIHRSGSGGATSIDGEISDREIFNSVKADGGLMCGIEKIRGRRNDGRARSGSFDMDVVVPDDRDVSRYRVIASRYGNGPAASRRRLTYRGVDFGFILEAVAD